MCHTLSNAWLMSMKAAVQYLLFTRSSYILCIILCYNIELNLNVLYGGLWDTLWLANCCEQGDEISGSIKCGKLKCYLLKKPETGRIDWRA
jgi:hypothetical protein